MNYGLGRPQIHRFLSLEGHLHRYTARISPDRFRSTPTILSKRFL